ncbi:MAG: SAF domain-containing protein [Nocardioidaceae bacterium]
MTPPGLRTFQRDLRRVLIARRRLLAALCAALAVGSSLQVLRPPQPARTQVAVAARDLATGTVVTAGDVVLRWFDPASVPAGLVPADTAPGRSVAAPMRRGEPFTDRRLVAPGLLDGYAEGTVLTTVRVADPSSVALLRPGDLVDVVGADPRNNESARVLATAAIVAAVPHSTADGGGTSATGAAVVLGVPEPVALTLAGAAAREQLSLLMAQ